MKKIIGIYPIVPSVNWIQRLAITGINTIQLRVKDQPLEFVENEIRQAIAISQQYSLDCYINDYWQLALEQGADALHLGQEDIQQADMERIKSLEVKLGISTHSEAEIDDVLQYEPDYIAIGPIFATQSKDTGFTPRGLERLREWTNRVDIPVVAIGGIDENNLRSVMDAGASGIAMISAITDSPQPEQTCKEFVGMFNQGFPDTCVGGLNE